MSQIALTEQKNQQLCCSSHQTIHNGEQEEEFSTEIKYLVPGQIFDENWICVVCNNFAAQPPSLSCCHLFCKQCLVQYFIGKSPEYRTCPVCRVVIGVTLPPENAYVSHKISQLQFRCNNFAQGCPQVGQIGQISQMGQMVSPNSIAKHFLDCEYELVRCDACKENILNKDKSSHQQVCIKRPQQCQHCKELVPALYMKQHMTNILCVNSMYCPNRCTVTGQETEMIPNVSNSVNGISVSNVANVSNSVNGNSIPSVEPNGLSEGGTLTEANGLIEASALTESTSLIEARALTEANLIEPNSLTLSGRKRRDPPKMETKNTTTIIRKSELEKHLRVCENQTIVCPVTKCKTVLKRKKLAQHFQEGFQTHMVSFLCQMEQTLVKGAKKENKQASHAVKMKPNNSFSVQFKANKFYKNAGSFCFNKKENKTNTTTSVTATNLTALVNVTPQANLTTPVNLTPQVNLTALVNPEVKANEEVKDTIVEQKHAARIWGVWKSKPFVYPILNSTYQCALVIHTIQEAKEQKMEIEQVEVESDESEESEHSEEAEAKQVEVKLAEVEQVESKQVELTDDQMIVDTSPVLPVQSAASVVGESREVNVVNALNVSNGLNVSNVPTRKQTVLKESLLKLSSASKDLVVSFVMVSKAKKDHMCQFSVNGIKQCKDHAICFTCDKFGGCTPCDSWLYEGMFDARNKWQSVRILGTLKYLAQSGMYNQKTQCINFGLIVYAPNWVEKAQKMTLCQRIHEHDGDEEDDDDDDFDDEDEEHIRELQIELSPYESEYDQYHSATVGGHPRRLGARTNSTVLSAEQLIGLLQHQNRRR